MAWLHSVGTVDSIEAINGIGHAAVASDPELRRTMAAHGYTLGADREIRELKPYISRFSQHTAQITRNLDRWEAVWRREHPGQVPGPAPYDTAGTVSSRACGHFLLSQGVALDCCRAAHAYRARLGVSSRSASIDRAGTKAASADSKSRVTGNTQLTSRIKKYATGLETFTPPGDPDITAGALSRPHRCRILRQQCDRRQQLDTWTTGLAEQARRTMVVNGRPTPPPLQLIGGPCCRRARASARRQTGPIDPLRCFPTFARRSRTSLSRGRCSYRTPDFQSWRTSPEYAPDRRRR